MNNHISLNNGYPACGKTSYGKQYESQWYYQLNQDELGRSLDKSLAEMDKLVYLL